jgi:hypothetical protein
MNHERIILELMERIQILESRVSEMERRMNASGQGDAQVDANDGARKNITSKYRGLTEYLLNAKCDRVALTYPELEEILGFSLPESAQNHMRAYWANTETHSYASSWLAIGYRTRVDVEGKRVLFEKSLTL